MGTYQCSEEKKGTLAPRGGRLWMQRGRRKMGGGANRLSGKM